VRDTAQAAMSEGKHPPEPAGPTRRADWPQIGDIIPNHDGFRPAATDLLAGFEGRLGGAIDALMRCARGNCEWTEAGRTSVLEYEAFNLGERLFLLDAMAAAPAGRSLTLLLDLAHGRALLFDLTFPTPAVAQSGLLSRLAETGSQSAVRVSYRQGPIGDSAAPPFQRTTALVGKHVRYVYSTTHVYDHYYLSDRYYAWFCRQGPDKDLGDFDECDYWEVGPRIYAVSWREKLLPCVGIMIENHSSMVATGKVCGVDAYAGQAANTRVGAYIRVISDNLAG
jgi:hypothetical protein